MNQEPITRVERGQSPELVFGLVGPVGTDLESVIQILKACLKTVRYSSWTVRLSELMEELRGEPWSELADIKYVDERMNKYMEAGNELRSRSGCDDAMVLNALPAIRKLREHEQHQPRRAYILRSLKRVEEVNTLRQIYGPAFFLIAAYSSRSDRERRLSQAIATSRHEFQAEKYVAEARALIRRDQDESSEPHGQRVAETFALADLSVNTANHTSAERQIERFIELLFGHPFHTPAPDEQGMYLARSAAVRSASPGRQVGAALCTSDGSVVSLGTNEVPKSGGGLYWTDDQDDGRDFRLGHDSSDRMKRSLIGDVLKRLKDAGWLHEKHSKREAWDLVADCLDGLNPPMKSAEFTRTIDFVRAVHAEMAALLEAARKGSATQDCVLYTTTFPCHDCAKHLVAAGVSRVVYVEPYPKSLVQDLCNDSVVFEDEGSSTKVHVDQFVGITPMRYLELFTVGNKKRKSRQGDTVRWVAAEATPTLPGGFSSGFQVKFVETDEADDFRNLLESLGLIKSQDVGGTA